MIRINLIQKKQASYVSSGGSRASAFKGLGKDGLDSLIPLLKSIGIPIVLCIAINFGYDAFTQQKTDEMKQELVKLDEEKDKINKELIKIKGFETVKVEVERSDLILRTKIDTIEKLIRGRDFTVKSLIFLAQSMPRDIWMTEVNATDTTFELRGGTVDLALVGDFMSKLGQTIYFKDVTLRSTASDPGGKQATFDLGARRE